MKFIFMQCTEFLTHFTLTAFKYLFVFNACKFYYYLKVRDQFSHPYKITIKMMHLFILISSVLESTQDNEEYFFK